MALFRQGSIAGFIVAAALPLQTLAQTPPQQAPQTAPQQGTASRPQKPAVKDTAAPAAASSEEQLKKRVEQLEEQLVDLQVVIGTLESLAKQPASAASYRAPVSGGAGDAARIDGLETQIRALTQQMEQLSADVRNRRGDTAGLQPPAGALQPDAGVLTPARPEPSSPLKTVPPSSDPIGGMLATAPTATPPAPPAGSLSGGAAGSVGGEDAKAAYEAAYGHMLQQDFGAAQAGFAEFLKRFPSHALVPNALYWLGETYYVQKNFTDAAEAFDIVLSAHSASNKAPDSQLKKAMSLSQLGKNSDACSALRQLAAKYPNAPVHVKTKADSERRRVGCL
jgi:tol-pal system protein YbgF